MTASAAKTFVKSERAALCDLLDRVGPDHPTLCEGWLTHDLAVHLWIRENDPIGSSGIMIKALSGLYARRAAELKQRWPYPELVDKVRIGPRLLSPFRIPGAEEAANTTEFFVHHEDVRRAGDAPASARDLDPGVEDWIWRRLKLLARGLFRRTHVGVVLERVAAENAGPETIRAVAGSSIVTLVGQPSELLLYANGRTGVAEVEIVGEPTAVDLLHSADLRV